jgi:DNA-binding transcriptional regulator GbsR (MarR family)
MGTNGSRPEKFNLAFTHEVLDELGLSLPAFRLYFHLVRRAGKKDFCYPGTRSIAHFCKMERKTIKTALKELERHKLIKVTRRRGSRHLYTICDQWKWYEPRIKAKDAKAMPQNIIELPSDENTTDREEAEPAWMAEHEFPSTWTRWVNHLDQAGKKPTASTAQLQRQSLAKLGKEGALITIHHSIEKGYKSLCEPKDLKQRARRRMEEKQAMENAQLDSQITEEKKAENKARLLEMYKGIGV